MNLYRNFGQNEPVGYDKLSLYSSGGTTMKSKPLKASQQHWQSIIHQSVQSVSEQIARGDHPILEPHHFSRFHFLRQFKKHVGETPGAMVKRLRQEKGIYLLRRTKLRIIDIAFECGYASQEAFSKEFKRSLGLSPSQLRELPHWSGGLFSPLDIHYHPDGLQNQWMAWQMKGGTPLMMKIATLQPYCILTLRGDGTYWNMPKTWQKFMNIVQEGSIDTSIEGYLSVFHDHHASISEDQKRWDLGLIVSNAKVTIPDLAHGYLPGGLYAIYVHFGCCEEIGPAWEAWSAQWLLESPYEIDVNRPSLEWYQGNPHILEPQLHLTFLCDPIKKKKNE